MTRMRLTGLIVAMAIAAVACTPAGATPPSVGDAPATTTTIAIEDTTTTTEFKPGRPARKLEDVESAVVQIVAHGSFEQPDGELVNVAGSGSGFLIDGTGLAVTNNHVVTGAAYLDVYVAGEDEPRRAEVISVSECDDLALIDIEGDFDIYLEWYEGTIQEGQTIFAAGFPLGDPTFTLYDGIVAKTIENLDTSWASVPTVIEHTAATKPGNSGGPIVTEDGQVIGVVYAGNSQQEFGISLPGARNVVETLAQGEDLDAIGINGEAFVTDSGFSGIWVSSVESGSPAAQAGILPGDIVTRIENLVVGVDGSMGEYCKVLRSHGNEDQLSVEVFRMDTGETLAGVINGSPLEVIDGPADDAGDTGDDSGENDGGQDDGEDQPPADDETMSIVHDSGQLAMEVPTSWTDVESGAWISDGTQIGLQLSASPDLDGFWDGWDTPGVLFSASTALADYSPDEFLDLMGDVEACTFDGRFDYDDGYYSGVLAQWSDCGETGSFFYIVVATPDDGSHLALVEMIEPTVEDRAGVEAVLNSFIAEGDL